MATVITNLLSAIPIFGHDLVESNDIIELINYKYNENITCLRSETLNIDILNICTLQTIGTVSLHASKKGKKIDFKEYLSIPYSFLAFFAGLIDGDGYIQITKTTKGYIQIKLVISIHLNDLSTIEYIYSVLNLGKIKIDRDKRCPTCKFIINKTDLQEIIFPLFKHHNIFFLTDKRRAQYDKAIFILQQNVKMFDTISNVNNIPIVYLLPPTSEDYINLTFFKNWIVGFTVAEGSFLIKNNNEACYQLKQQIHENLFKAIKLIFETNRNIYTEKGLYFQFSVSSKKDIQTVINFFSFSGLHPLVGLKSIQYLKWLDNLSQSFRYKYLHFPVY